MAETVADFWTLKREAMRHHLVTEPLEQFPQWSTIVATMFVGPTAYMPLEWAALRADDAPRWERAIGAEINGYPNTNLAHQAYHLLQWERHTGLRVEQLSRIVEVGGGYGACARVCRALGFTGAYVIYDLPEMVELQRYYLDRCGVAAECRDVFSGGEQADLLVGLFSLSEMSIAEQARYLGGIDAPHFLAGLHDAPWQGVDTHAPLDSYFGGRGGQRVEIPHIAGRYYLIG